ncbi:MAG TPA: class II aldolase/adducin family protein [Chromatiaceae bacterium]|nr:class II aldolase/adducin family protein [Chromatiaceae bacterium]
MNHAGEGVIKFHLEHTQTPALPVEETAGLRAWFPILRQTDLVGQHPERYEGYAYGNISRRHGDGFIISCTQTSGKTTLLPDDFSLVTTFDAKANRLHSEGPCSPSSEAMTHGAVYQALPAAGAVFHVHSSLIWRQSKSLGLPETDPDVEYGTPEMAECVAELLETRTFSDSLVFSMGGHEDGVVACAYTPEKAGLVLIKTLASAYQLSKNPAWSN